MILSPVLIAVIAAALLAGGITVLVRELVPAPPDLRAALARLDGREVARAAQLRADTARRLADLGVTEARIGGRLARYAADRPVLLRARPTDLEILDRTPESVMVRKALFAVGGLALPTLATLPPVLVGVGVPFVLPAAAGLLFAVLGWVLVDLDLHERAAAARVEFQRALCSYIDLVALERKAASSTHEALEHAANIGDGWVFTRLRDALLHARLSGQPPWEGLRALGERIGVVEVEDLASIMQLTGEGGVAVYESLLAKSASLRDAISAREESTANAASERLAIPTSLLVLVFMVWLGYPAVARMLFG